MATFSITIQAADPDATTIVVLDGAGIGAWGVTEWDPGNSVWETQWGGDRGNLGQLPASSTPTNRQPGMVLSCWPADMDEATDLRTDLGRVLDLVAEWGGRVTYQHTNQTYRQHLRVFAGGVETRGWTPRSEIDGRHDVAVRFTAAPHVEGDPLGWSDTFADGLGAWTPDTTTNLTTGQDGLTAGASGTWMLANRIPGHSLYDLQMTARFTPVLSGTPRVDLVLKDTGTHRLIVRAADSGSATTIQVVREEIGVGETVVSSNSTTRMATGQTHTLTGRINRNAVTVEWWVATPADPLGTPTNTYTTALTGTAATVVGSATRGTQGIEIQRSSGALTVHDVEAIPSAAATTTSEPVEIRGVPGDTAAAVEVDLHLDPPSSGASGTQERFGLIAAVPAVTRDIVTDGGFGLTDTPAHWDDTNYSGILTTGKGTLTRDTAVARTGLASGRVATTGSGQGVLHLLNHTFHAGVTYTASVWVRSTGSPSIRVRLGVSGDIASSASSTAAAGWQQRTVSWTPATTVHRAYLAIEQTNSGSLTWWVDDASVIEGATAAVRGGWGGHPCDGVLDAVDTVSPDGTVNLSAGATFLHGTALTWSTTTAGAGQYLLDTSRITPDEPGGAVMVEAWLKASVPTVETTIVAWAESPNNTDTDARAYTLEHGSAGITQTPGSPNAFHLFRLGTLPLLASPEPTLLTVTQAYGTNQSWSWSHLILVPAARRACSPTGLTDTTGYPVFAATTGALGASRRFTSDLRGARRPPATDAWMPAAPLEGPPLEVRPGDSTIIVATAGNAPNSGALHGSVDSHRGLLIHPQITPRWRYLRNE